MPNALTLKEGTYYFHLRVAEPYRAHYPKTHITFSLKTKDKTEAKRLAAKHLTEVYEEWDRIRTTGFKTKTTLTPEETQKLILRAIQMRLRADDAIRSEGVDDWLFERMQEMHEQANQSERMLIARGIIDDHLSVVLDEWLVHSTEYDIPVHSPEYNRIAREFVKAQIKVTKAFMERHLGNPVETDEVLEAYLKKTIHTQEISKASSPLLSEVITYFMDNYDKAKPMYRKHTQTLSLLLESIGDKPVAELRQMDLENYAKMICNLPPRWSDITRKQATKASELAKQNHDVTLSKGTFDGTYMASLGTFLKESKRVFGDSGFPSNLTADGIKYTGEREEEENNQRAFTHEELKRLFEGDEIKAFAASPKEHHKYWLPLIGLYTGARVNEICQLNPQSDIREEENIWIFDFNENDDTDSRVTKSIKNQTSIRKISIHSRLLELGFLAYLEGIKATGSKLLFPLWKPSRGKASAKAEEWFREFLKEINLRDETPGKRIVGMHSFRSTFLNRGNNLGIANLEVITGHASEKSKVIRGYQGEMALKSKQEILEKVFFELSPPVPKTNR